MSGCHCGRISLLYVITWGMPECRIPILFREASSLSPSKSRTVQHNAKYVSEDRKEFCLENVQIILAGISLACFQDSSVLTTLTQITC